MKGRGSISQRRHSLCSLQWKELLDLDVGCRGCGRSRIRNRMMRLRRTFVIGSKVLHKKRTGDNSLAVIFFPQASFFHEKSLAGEGAGTRHGNRDSLEMSDVPHFHDSNVTEEMSSWKGPSTSSARRNPIDLSSSLPSNFLPELRMRPRPVKTRLCKYKVSVVHSPGGRPFMSPWYMSSGLNESHRTLMR